MLCRVGNCSAEPGTALQSRELLGRAGNCSGEPGSDQGRQDVIVRENNIVLGVGTSSGRSLRRQLSQGIGSVIITAAA